MGIKVRTGGSLETITSGKVMVGGILRTLKTIKVMHGGTLRTVKQFTTALSANASPTTVNGTAFNSNPQTITTGSATVTPTGGTGPFTYSWALVSSSGGSASVINSASFATTSFTKANVADGELWVDVFRCTVTDSFGQTATADVTAVFSNNGSLS